MPSAATLATAAAMASPLSKPLMVDTDGGACRGAGTAGAETPERCPVCGAATRAAVPPVGGVGGFGAVPGAAAGAAAEAVCGGGEPVGNVGNLMVGDAVGLGGKLIRTVSFFG